MSIASISRKTLLSLTLFHTDICKLISLCILTNTNEMHLISRKVIRQKHFNKHQIYLLIELTVRLTQQNLHHI